MRVKVNSELFKEIKRKLKTCTRKEIQYDYELGKSTVHMIANSPTYKDYKHRIDLTRPDKRNLI